MNNVPVSFVGVRQY